METKFGGYITLQSFGGTVYSGGEQLAFSYDAGERISDDIPGPLIVEWLRKGRIKKVKTTQTEGTNQSGS